MEAGSPQLAQLKSALKASWMAGDLGEISKFTAIEAETFVGRLRMQPGLKVLDVACGTGNIAIPAARAGAQVVGVDIAPNLLEQARKRAAAEKLAVKFEDGDAEALPYPDSAFDLVITMFGAMFAPRPDRVAAELLRVSKPGGTIAMANWTSEGFIGKSFRTTAQWVPPPPGIPVPLLWGDEKVVRERFGNAVSELRAERRVVRIHYPFPPERVVELFREYFGPTKMTFARLDEGGKIQLAAQLECLWREHNLSHDGTTEVEAEYLEVKAIRA